MRLLPLALLISACAAPPAGLRATPDGDGPLVRVDWDAVPLPDIPFPNDLATRSDPTSPTGLRPNLPLDAPVELERKTREKVDDLSGFAIFAPITVGFEGRLDLDAILERHPPLEAFTPDSFADDAIYVIDVTPGSPDYLQPVALDVGTQRFPTDATELGTFLADDPRASEPSLLWETGEEDLDGDGVLGPGEDTDNDGLLDHPNVWPPGADHRTGVLSFYDLQTDTLQVRPVTPLREETTYAVVLTSALVDEDGQPARSPWDYVNHLRQTAALEPVPDALDALGRSVDDVAFAWTFTTGRVTGDLWDLAEGVRGRGVFAHLADDYPAGITEAHVLWTPDDPSADPLMLPLESVFAPLAELGLLPESSLSFLEDGYPAWTSGIVGGAFTAADLLYDRDDGGRDDSDESWDVDSSTGYVDSAPRRITFTCVLPKAGDGVEPPWDVDIHMHGYGSTRVEQVAFAYALNRNGIASCGIDAVGHGLDLSPEDLATIQSLVGLTDAEPLLYHLLDDRVRDLDNDGVGDAAGDAFSADPFHTRDMFRQPVLDVVQLIESLKRCGTGEMEEVIPTKDGPLHQKEYRTTCDWDGDGKPDIGGPGTRFTLEGVSMGGIMSSLGAAVQDIDAAVLTVPGGGLADVGVRSDIRAVSDGMVGRALSPLVLADVVGSSLVISELVVSVDHTVSVPVATIPLPPAGSKITVRNLDLGTDATGEIPASGGVRVPIGANAMDAAEKAIAAGIPSTGVVAGETYEIPDNAGLGDRLQVVVRTPDGDETVIDTFAEGFVEEGVTVRKGSPLVAVSWGLGLRRGSSDLRRTLGVLAMAIEPADPISYARRWVSEPFDDDPTSTLIHLTVGDTTVPIGTGLALARAAKLIHPDRDDARYGSTVDRWLVDRGVVRGMEELGPYTDAGGHSILFDPDDLDRGADGSLAPSDAPLRANLHAGDETLALRMLYVNPTGQHAYYFPDQSRAFDFDLFGAQQMAWFLATGGEVSDDPCLATPECPFLRPAAETP